MILQCNGYDFTMVTHKKAVDYIKKFAVLNMLVARKGVTHSWKWNIYFGRSEEERILRFHSAQIRYRYTIIFLRFTRLIFSFEFRLDLSIFLLSREIETFSVLIHCQSLRRRINCHIPVKIMVRSIQIFLLITIFLILFIFCISCVFLAEVNDWRAQSSDYWLVIIDSIICWFVVSEVNW